jgi:glycosyltransferase involved in cell wall biosynthesis
MMNDHHVAVAIPAYNEADGIAEFLAEIDTALTTAADRVTLVVVDDASSDGTAEIVDKLRSELRAEVVPRPDGARGLRPGPRQRRRLRASGRW